MNSPVILSGLYPQAYEHPDDLAALDALKRTGGLETLVKKVSSWGVERMLRIQLTGSFLRVTPDNFPDLWQLFTRARNTIDLPIVPDLYIKNQEEINAFTAGVEKPVVVINSGAIDHLDEQELLFVLAHELGHIKSGHVLYYQIASYLPLLGDMVGDFTLGIGNFLSLGLQVALLHWQRTSELTADRAGLLVCQDAETALRALMKLAGLPRKYAPRANVSDFIQQARAFEASSQTTGDKIAKYLSIHNSSHPWTVMRAKELLDWIESGGYQKILNKSWVVPAGVAPIKRFCDQCGLEAKSNDIFCSRCGHRLT